MFLPKRAECVGIFRALRIKLPRYIVYRGGTGSFQFGKPGIHISLVCVQVTLDEFYLAEDFIQQSLGGMCLPLVAEDRLVVGVDGFRLSFNRGN